MRMWGSKRESEPGVWLSDTARKAVLGFGIAFVVYSALLIALVMTDGSAPRVAERERLKAHLWVLAGILVVAFLAGLLNGARGIRREAATGVCHQVPAYVLGYQWFFTGLRLWITGSLLAISMVLTIVTVFIPEAERLVGGPLSNGSLIALAYSVPWMAWATTLKGRELRRGKERIQVADEYLEIREARLNQEHIAMTEKFLYEQQEWRSQKMAELYEQILDQQARGVLPCPNCEGHRRSA
jgi:hypothetical protein